MTFKKIVVGEDIAFSNVSTRVHFGLFNIFNRKNIYRSVWESKNKLGAVFNYLMKVYHLSVSEVFEQLNCDLLVAAYKQQEN